MYSLDYYLQWAFGGFLLVFLILTLSYQIWLDLKQKRITPFTGLSMGYLFFMVAPLVLLHVNGEYNKPVFTNLYDIPDLTISTSFVATIYVLSCGFMVAVMHHYWGRVESVNTHRFDKEIYIRYLVVVFVIYFVTVIYDVVSTGLLSGDGHWYYSKQDAMESSQISVLLVYIKHALRWIVLAVLFLGFDKKYLSNIQFYLLLILYLAVSVYFSGNRFGIALAGMALVIIYIKRRQYLALVVMGVIAAPIAWFGTMFMWVRGVMHGYGGGLTGMFELMFELQLDANLELTKLLQNMFEGVNFNVLNAIIRDFPHRLEFMLGETFIKPFVFWIPRSIWPDKPDRLSQTLGMEYAGDEHLSLVSTFPGELWANFGILSLVMIVPFVLVFVRVLKLAFARYEFGGWLIFFYMFTMSRASYGGTVIEIFFAALLMIAVHKIVHSTWSLRVR